MVFKLVPPLKLPFFFILSLLAHFVVDISRSSPNCSTLIMQYRVLLTQAFYSLCINYDWLTTEINASLAGKQILGSG